MSWLVLLRYLPAVLGVVAALWYRGESLHAWGVADKAQQSNQLLTSDNESLVDALDQLEKQQRDNAKSYRRAIADSQARGNEAEALWIHQKKAADSLRQELTALRAQSKDVVPSECKQSTSIYEIWADGLLPDGVIAILQRRAAEAGNSALITRDDRGTRSVEANRPTINTGALTPGNAVAGGK